MKKIKSINMKENDWRVREALSEVTLSPEWDNKKNLAMGGFEGAANAKT